MILNQLSVNTSQSVLLSPSQISSQESLLKIVQVKEPNDIPLDLTEFSVEFYVMSGK